MKLHQKTVVITGGAKGLGKALAELFVKKGARVVICDKDEQALKKTEKEINLISFTIDTSNEIAVQNVATKVTEEFGKIDIWINNAGIWMQRQLLLEIDLEKSKRLFNTNFFGTVHGMQTAIKHMSANDGGVIINIISTTAFDNMNGSSGSMYVASKYALRGLTRSVQEELKTSNINLIAVYPGGMKTDLFENMRPKNIDQFLTPEEVSQKIVQSIELKVLPEEIIIKRNS